MELNSEMVISVIGWGQPLSYQIIFKYLVPGYEFHPSQDPLGSDDPAHFRVCSSR